jgi:hypothetical protein
LSDLRRPIRAPPQGGLVGGARLGGDPAEGRPLPLALPADLPLPWHQGGRQRPPAAQGHCQKPLQRRVPGPAGGGSSTSSDCLASASSLCSPLRARPFRLARSPGCSLSSALSWPPLTEAIRRRNATADVLHADESSWPDFVKLPERPNHRWWPWVFTSKDTVVYVLKPARDTAVVAEHLGIDLDAEQPCLPGGGSSFSARTSTPSTRALGPVWRRYGTRGAGRTSAGTS